MKYALYTLAYLYVFYMLYIFIMGVYRAYLAKRLSIYTAILCAPLVLAGALVDVMANMTLATIICLELPREWLVTERFKRYLQTLKTAKSGLLFWRYSLARFVCDNLLDVFAPDGNHCEDLTAKQAASGLEVN